MMHRRRSRGWGWLLTGSLALPLTAVSLAVPPDRDLGVSETASHSDAALAEGSPTEDGGSEEGSLISNPRQITFEGRRAGEGYFSGDGRRMVFQSERDPANPFYQIYLSDLETGDIERISPGQGKTTCAWIHPAGDRVLFASTHHDPESVAKQKAELELRASGKQRRYAWDYDPAFEIYARDLDSGQ
jgi:hypothetical protein